MSYNPYGLSPFNYDFLGLADAHRLQRDLGTLNKTKDDQFSYKCNVHGFKHDEIEVHQEGDTLKVNCIQRHNGPYESFERTLTRIIRLPSDINHETIRTELNEKGEMLIHADKKTKEKSTRRSIPLVFKKSDQQIKDLHF